MKFYINKLYLQIVLIKLEIYNVSCINGTITTTFIKNMYVSETKSVEKFYFLARYYALMFLRGIFFFKIYAALVLKDTLTPIQVSNVISIYSITTIILEIPLGFLAGKIGYKNVILLGVILYIMSYFGLIFDKTVLTFSIYYACRSLYSSVFDSSFEALVYGNIRHYGLKDLFTEYRNLSRLARLVAISSASYIAGKIIWNNVNAVLICDLFILFLDVFLLLGITERKTEGTKKLNKNYRKLFVNSVKYMIRNRVMRNFLIFQSFWVALISLTATYRSIFCEEISSTSSVIGGMLALQTIVAALAQFFFVKRLASKSSSFKILLFFVSGIFCLLAMYYYKGLTSYLLYTIFFILLQVADSLTYPNTLNSIPERLMPVLLPAFNIITELFKFIILYVFGYVANANSYRSAFIVMFSIFTFFSLFAYLITRYDKHLLKKEYGILK